MMRFTAWMLTAVFSLAGVPCAADDGDQPTLVVVLVDTSVSTKDAGGEYRRAWSRIMANTRGGDRIVIAVVEGLVGRNEASVLRHVMDRALPSYSVWRDNPLTYDSTLANVRGSLTKHFEDAFGLPRGNKTELLRSIRDAGRILSDEQKRRKVLIVMSDLLEDSEHRFDQTALTPGFTRRLIDKLKNEGRLPQLSGVEVHMALPGTTRPMKADELERFFISFFAATGATLGPAHFGMLLTYRR